ncbi:hypothetical protein D9758_016208 [Tetrapyrgos nigripes]|uniref:Bacteriophage T5 Orf172 DNA-binding domain-containing protein n=1 Tax=Tetrapyrgos nigripes TaxID=182062 RepID=A0A8H5FNK5_9AGAR|nr:hypothetical protein D9758_016208 [Tetrapyrgos nigripes]
MDDLYLKYQTTSDWENHFVLLTDKPKQDVLIDLIKTSSRKRTISHKWKANPSPSKLKVLVSVGGLGSAWKLMDGPAVANILAEARAAADARCVAEGNNDEVTRALGVAMVLESAVQVGQSMQIDGNTPESPQDHQQLQQRKMLSFYLPTGPDSIPMRGQPLSPAMQTVTEDEGSDQSVFRPHSMAPTPLADPVLTSDGHMGLEHGWPRKPGRRIWIYRQFLVFRDWVDRPVSARVKRDAWVYVLSFRNGKACKIGCTRRTPRHRLQEWRCKDKSKGFKLVYSVRVSEERMFGIGKNAAVDEEEEAIRTRLEAIGLHVGANFAERLCQDRSLFTETLDVIKFVCKDLWAACWDRQVDNLRTNHRGIYVLQDNAFKTITHLSSWEGRADATRKAKLGSNSVHDDF